MCNQVSCFCIFVFLYTFVMWCKMCFEIAYIRLLAGPVVKADSTNKDGLCSIIVIIVICLFGQGNIHY